MSYPGNYVADDTHADDPSCPNFKDDPNPYDVEQPETCILCGELIEIGGGQTVLSETVCDDCYNYEENTIDEMEKMIKKLKR